MKAAKVFLTTKDIAAITGMSIRSAQNVMYVFARKGQVVKCGDSNRGCMVDINVFVKYLCDQDGVDEKQRKKDIQECLRESYSISYIMGEK